MPGPARASNSCTTGGSSSSSGYSFALSQAQFSRIARYRETISVILLLLHPIARYGVFGDSAWPNGCDAPSPFSERFPLGEHVQRRCDTPTPQRGYLSDTCAIPNENKANGCDPSSQSLRCYLKRGLRDMGGYLALGR